MNRIFCAMILFTCLCYASVHAQVSKYDSLYALQDGRMPSLVSLTGNPAALWHTPFANYTQVMAGWKHQSGDLRRPMEAAASNTIGAGATGFAKVNNWRYQGAVQYSRRYDRQLSWSGVHDPYNGNPFIWADSSTGNWERDHLLVSASLVTPQLLQNWHAGIKAGYHVGSGARKSDPKPFYRYRQLSLQPGVTWQPGKHAVIGIYGTAAFSQEDNELGFYNNGTNNVLLYRLRGYGTFSKSPFVSGERQQKGTRIGGGAHYSYENDRVLASVGFHGSRNDETVYEGVAIRQTVGYFTDYTYGGIAAIFFKGKGSGRYIKLSGDGKNGYADDMVFRAQSASMQQFTLQASAGTWRGTLQWEIRPFFDFNEYVDMATRTLFSTTAAGGMLELSWRKGLGRSSFQLKPAAGYRYLVNDQWQHGTENVIIRELIQADYRYFATSGMLASFTSVFMPRAGHALEVQAALRKAGGHDKQNIQLQYSIIF